MRSQWLSARRPAWASLGLWLHLSCAAPPLRTTPPRAPPIDATFAVAPDRVRLYTSITGEGTQGAVWFVLGPEVSSRAPYPRLTAALHAAGYATAFVHPHGTGYSDGARGDIDDYSKVLDDYHRFGRDLGARFHGRQLFLLGHSAGAAFALEVAAKGATPIAGVVLVNPAYKLIYSTGMGPSFGDYFEYGFNYVFRPAALTADMNARPEAVRDPDDRAEALAMRDDPLGVRHFSMRYLSAQREVMNRCVENARKMAAPLLLIEGARDALVDPAGSDEIFRAAATQDKKRLASTGGHGSSSVETVVEPLVQWLLQRGK